MRWLVAAALFSCFWSGQIALQAQSVSLAGREIAIHGFASQGFVYTDTNNWLTMNSTSRSAAFTDVGVNMSTTATSRFRVGAQAYDENLGRLGHFRAMLDWLVADYRLKSWMSFRGGKVKTVRGLYNDSQDLDFLHSFALLPQSIYPADLRDTIAHGAATFMGISLSNIPSATFHTRSTPGTEATACAVAIPICSRSTGRFS